MTLTLPDGLVLREGENATDFNKTVYFQSNQKSTESKNVIAKLKTHSSYSFNVTIQLDYGEIITFYTTWNAKSQAAGKYNITVLAFSNDASFDPQFKACQDTYEATIVEDVPTIYEPLVFPVKHLTDLEPNRMYANPRQALEIRCNVTSIVGIRNVTLHYSIDSGHVWNETPMFSNMNDEWNGSLSGQSEGEQIVLYIEAFSSTEKSSRTGEYTITFSDLQALDLKTGIAATGTGIVIVVGCLGILLRRRRRMVDAL